MNKIILNGSGTKLNLSNILRENNVLVSNSMSKSELMDKVFEYNSAVDSGTTEELGSKFSVDQRFEFLSRLTRIVASGQARSLVVLGDGGLGKTFTVIETINKLHLSENEVHTSKGYCTPRGLYNMLFDNNGKLIIFDDSDSVLEDKTSISVLKAALDSHDKRVLNWSTKIKKSDIYPQTFEFTGRVIFISNKNKKDIDPQILDRSYVMDLELSTDEKIQRMEKVLPAVIKNNNYDIYVGMKALDFLKENKHKTKKLSIRTLLDVIGIINGSDGSEWMELADYTITNQK